jgi:AcrR family transcriptional regulator
VRLMHMRSIPDDRTTRAVIRDEALRLFATGGPESVTVRQIAEAAGVSAGLVVHHFGSKDGLRQEVDQYVLAVFEAMLGELTGEGGTELLDPGTGAGSLSEAFARHLPADSPMPGYLRRLPAHRLPDLHRGHELVRLLGYERHEQTATGELSGGTRQKLNLTLALLHDPDVLLLDEPYQGFDWETYLRFWDLAEELRARGKAVVIITHLVFEQDRFDLLADLTDGRLTPRTPAREEGHVRA